MENSPKVVSLTVLVTLVTVVACELNMTASSQTTPSGSASALLDCDSSTCVEFTGQGYTDLLVWLPEPASWSTTVSLIGTDLLCWAHDQGRLYVVPSTTLEPMGLMSTCRLMNATTEGQLDVCTFSCQDTAAASQDSALEAVRVTRRPFQPSHGDWTLCGLDVTDPDVCPAGYSHACDHCYLYNATGMTLDDARDYCTSTHPGAYLVEVDTVGENGFVRGLVGYPPWLGARRLSGTMTWTHSGRNVSAGYENWHPVEPNGSGDCMAMSSSSGDWYDKPCGIILHVVCEYGN